MCDDLTDIAQAVGVLDDDHLLPSTLHEWATVLAAMVVAYPVLTLALLAIGGEPA